MGILWIAGAEKITPSKPGGTPSADEASHPPRVIWHTTEAPSGNPAMFQSMIDVLKNKGDEPQVLWDPVTDRLGQFMPLDHTGRAVQNDGSTRSNRIGRVCIQIEVIAYSSKPFTDYWKPGPKFRALMDAIRSWGIPDVFPMGNPPKYPGGSVRDRTIWLSKGGHYCHANVPGNSHGDPGAISPAKLFAAAPKTVIPPAKPPVTPPKPPVEDTLSAQDVSDGIRDYLHDFYGPTGTGQTLRNDAKQNAQAIVDATKAASDAQVAALGELTAAVKALAAGLPKASA